MASICYQCFREIKTDGPCPFCGTDAADRKSKYSFALIPSSMLSKRYLVGYVQAADSAGIAYAALDERTRRRVEVREYFPAEYAGRDTDNLTVVVPSDRSADFAAGKKRFLSQWLALAGLGESGQIPQIQDAFEENETAYAVIERVSGLNLKRFTAKLGRPLRVEETRRLFLPLISVLEKAHAKGIFHENISPECVLITRDGAARLIHFGQTALPDQEDHAQRGYSSIERHSPQGETGPWTDIYSIAATMYYAITGRTPPAAEERQAQDTLQPPSVLGTEIDNQTEAVLLKAMSVQPADRWQSMRDFRDALCGESPSSIAFARRVEPEKRKAVRRKRRRVRAALCLIVLALLISLFGVVGGDKIAMNAISGYLGSGTAVPETPAPTPRPTPIITPSPTPEPLHILALAAGQDFTVALRSDGRVFAAGGNAFGQCNVSEWKKITSIAVGAGEVSDTGLSEHLVGVKKNGTVVAVGNNAFGQCNVSGWEDIIAVSAGWSHTLGLRKDGTVVAAGTNSNGQCDVSGWTDIVAIAAGEYYSVGLKADGTVVAAGYNGDGQCSVSEWRDIVAISAARWHTVGLKADGTVVAAGRNESGRCDVSDWTDIIAVSAGRWHTLGLKSDGTVVAVGRNVDGRCNVSNWDNIVSIAAGWEHSAGLRADGTMVFAGSTADGRCDTEKLTGE